MSIAFPLESPAQFPGWPSRASREVMHLKASAREMKTRLHLHGVKLVKDDAADGLGPYEAFFLTDHEIGLVALVTHTTAPYKATEVVVDAGVAVDAAVARLVDMLGLEGKDVRWAHPKSTFARTIAKPPLRPAMPTIGLTRVAAELADRRGMTRKDASATVGGFVGLVVKHLKKGNRVRLTGLGILQVRKSAARMGRNPATGEAIRIKASKKVAFRVAKNLRDAI